VIYYFYWFLNQFCGGAGGEHPWACATALPAFDVIASKAEYFDNFISSPSESGGGKIAAG